eukprot:1870655-Pyramimonas_sp.AAC.1
MAGCTRAHRLTCSSAPRDTQAGRLLKATTTAASSRASTGPSGGSSFHSRRRAAVRTLRPGR